MKILQVALLSTLLAVSPLVIAHGWINNNGDTRAAGVPELDVGAAGVSFGLVLVITALIRERRKRN